MNETTFGPYRMVAAGLLGAGLFAVFYPAIVWLFARRIFAAHHVYFLGAGVVLLLLGALFIWMGRVRPSRRDFGSNG
jgi:hypothetical protein